MNITVLGLWHLGSVTAACSARHFQVVGFDFDAANIARLNSGQAPLFKPGLNELITAGLAAKKLSFTTDPQIACAKADVLGSATTRRSMNRGFSTSARGIRFILKEALRSSLHST